MQQGRRPGTQEANSLDVACSCRQQGNENAPMCEPKSQRPGQGRHKLQSGGKKINTPESEESCRRATIKRTPCNRVYRSLYWCQPAAYKVRRICVCICVCRTKDAPSF